MIGASVVLFHNPIQEVIRTLDALGKQSEPVATVLIHINESAAADDQMRVALKERGRALGFDLDVTHSADNLGFATAHNLALARLFAARCDAALVLNPDLVLDAAAVAALRSAQVTAGGCALLGPVLELADPGTMTATGRIDSLGIRWTRSGRHFDAGQGAPTKHMARHPYVVPGISGACLWIPESAYRRVHEACGEFFDEDFIAYREDAELGYRAQLLGVHSYLVPAAKGLHIRRLRGTTRGMDPFIDMLGVRNRFLIAFKYGRARPGGVIGPALRDVVVILGVLLTERTSVQGLREAWHIRHTMRAKGRRVRLASRQASKLR